MQIELAETVIKALHFRLTIFRMRREGVDGSGCGPGALFLLSASPVPLETELWEREVPLPILGNILQLDVKDISKSLSNISMFYFLPCLAKNKEINPYF